MAAGDEEVAAEVGDAFVGAAEAVDAVRRLPQIDRRQVRATFERRFSAEIMASNYVDLYERRCRVAPALPAWPVAWEAAR